MIKSASRAQSLRRQYNNESENIKNCSNNFAKATWLRRLTRIWRGPMLNDTEAGAKSYVIRSN